ncbi:MAG: pyridoxal phosphate-dependent aminotransferase [Candidatus Latescibacteria bacterium]|nr:aminotransferase class I/II [Gemmatimonadaceae bacterium]MDP6015356.1 pyridoxal phosphate-dependent aminotransferase [Candidatus Latescibacterota bacterium]MDP7447055.1 pyridoxal phosphate-dependent aminotransferase [Candidatus Latescibacterota bacterium]HJP33490.1 pyridoxal phosphate-dependent aminotransferase [Candidatus Latescibacterota bacterium]
MKPFAAAPTAIPRSGIREIMDLAWATPGAIHLEVGQPDFDTPEHIVEATCRYAREGHTRYVPNGGVDPLREAAARYVQDRTGVETGAENILVTQGAVLSMATAFLSLTDPGDEVLLPDPGWPNYAMALSLFQGRPVYYDLRAENSFLPDPEQIEGLITPRTKLLLLCSPSNPTGQVHDEGLTKALMDVARRHDLWVLADEIYGEIVFDGSSHVSCVSHDPDGRVLLVSGMSKAYAMTGYRVGFTRACTEYIDMASKLQEPLVSCGVGFSQMAAVEALEGPQDCVGAMRDAYQRRRDVAIEVLRQYDLYRYTPGGAFYLLIDISASGMESLEFCHELIREHKVAVAPGSTFGKVCADHVRISIASPEENVREGVRRICEMVQEKASTVVPTA